MSLSPEDYRLLNDLFVKADTGEVTFIRIKAERELRKRYEVSMSKEFGFFGNDVQGYRLPSGVRVKELEE